MGAPNHANRADGTARCAHWPPLIRGRSAAVRASFSSAMVKSSLRASHSGASRGLPTQLPRPQHPLTPAASGTARRMFAGYASARRLQHRAGRVSAERPAAINSRRLPAPALRSSRGKTPSPAREWRSRGGSGQSERPTFVNPAASGFQQQLPIGRRRPARRTRPLKRTAPRAACLRSSCWGSAPAPSRPFSPATPPLSGGRSAAPAAASCLKRR